MPSRTARLAALAIALAVVTAARPAGAVVIQTASGTDNTTAPVWLPEFNNVGRSRAAGGNSLGTAIYLGDGWVITAGHVGGGGIVLASGTYFEQAGTGFTLVNDTPGRTTYTDLYMYRLQTSPVGLPTIRIASASPAAGKAVTMIGAGRDRGAFTEWAVNTATTPYTWTVTTGTNANAAGYTTLSTRAVRWGTNNVDTSNLWFPMYYTSTAYNDVKGFSTVFNIAPDTSEAQAVLRDSGGAVFTQNGSQWELSGVISTIAGFSGQPDPRTTPVFGNATYSADLSFYRSQIVAAVPEPGTLALVATAAAGLPLARSLRRRRALREQPA